MENSLLKKLQVKEGSTVLIINSPDNYLSFLEPIPNTVKIAFSAEGEYDVIQLFIYNSSQLKEELDWLIKHLKSKGVLWITYPKKSSGIVSDLSMMSSWDELEKYNLKPVAAIAINKDWTGIRVKPADEVKLSSVRNSLIKRNEFGNFIDVENKIVKLPEDLKQRLQDKPETIMFFESLSYTNKKEYILWILSAKQEKTRRDRIEKTFVLLGAQKKNPNTK